MSKMDSDTLIREYLLLGLRFDRIEQGYVDSFTGDQALRRAVADEPAPDPAALSRQARHLLAALEETTLERPRADYLRAHLRALDCAGRKFAGEPVGFVDEVRDYFDVSITKGDPERYREAHAKLDAALGGSGPLGERMQAYRAAEEIPPERLADCINAFSSALRDRVRAEFPLDARETITYEIVTDKPWSGFNYYEGDYRSTVAVNADLKQQMSNLPRLVAHESYPGHHTEHCRKEAGLVEKQGQLEQTIFLVNTPQCLMAEGLADLALHAVVGPGWGAWAAEIYADLGLTFDGERAEAISEASAQLADVRQDAALMLHDEHRDVDDVAAFLQRWLLVNDARARQALRFLSSPLWRAYTSTYIEGYRLLRGWLDDRPAEVSLTAQFTRLLDEPLIPSSLRAA
ncbi:CalR9 protein [Mycolicibacterium tokaiense]|uniref:CalR9 protein n=2 Tax=Mycolicibacterium tokaiense TaxID=39695 RepID=A0A378TKP1_9MYCO|nr:CalR9 protein [Mycolicibacterium tokaiense]